MITQWTCPICNMLNQDDNEETARPLCGDCGKELDWWEVYDIKNQETLKTTRLAPNAHK